jgi:hypothetical protein
VKGLPCWRILLLLLLLLLVVVAGSQRMPASGKPSGPSKVTGVSVTPADAAGCGGAAAAVLVAMLASVANVQANVMGIGYC